MKLQAVRLVRRLSVQELAEKAGVAFTTIQDLEAGKAKPRMATVRKLEKALGVNGQLIDEFRPVLGEPSEALKAWTPTHLANSIERLQQGPTSTAMSREEFWQRAKQLETSRESTEETIVT